MADPEQTPPEQPAPVVQVTTGTADAGASVEGAAVAMAAVAGAAAATSQQAAEIAAEVQNDIEETARAVQEVQAWQNQLTETVTGHSSRLEAITTAQQAQGEALGKIGAAMESMLSILQPKSPPSGEADRPEVATAPPTSPAAEADNLPPPEKPSERKRRWI